MDRTQTRSVARPRSRSWHSPALLVIGAAVIAACGGSNTVTGPPLGTAAGLTLLTQPPTSVAARATMTPAPVVQIVDRAGTPVDTAGLVITASIATGGGSVGGTTTATTNASGQATFSSLSISGTAGAKALQFTTGQISGVQSNSLALTAGPASNLISNSQVTQSGVVNQAVSSVPSVKAVDLDGNVVSGVAVTFAVQSGGGSVNPTSAIQTSASGVATVTSWTLGASVGTNTLTASATGLTGSPVTFTATGGAVVSNYNIDLRFLGTGTPGEEAAFTAAKTRWEQVITGDVPAISISLVNDTLCTSDGQPNPTPLNVNGSVDDIVIFADLRAIDGPGGILGAAGPCIVRNAGGTTIVGYMKFDTADLATLEATGALADVALHEMGHVIGYGTLGAWTAQTNLNSADPLNPFFTGPKANAAYLTEGGAASVTPTAAPCDVAAESRPRSAVPVENNGSAGTVDSHWEECVFRSELMTGFISGSVRPLSKTTIQSMADLGYVVNLGAADPFNLSTQPTIRAEGPAGPALDLHHDVLRNRIRMVDLEGRAAGSYQR